MLFFIVLVLLELIALVPLILVPLIELLILLPLIGLVAAFIVPAVVRGHRRRAAAFVALLVLGVILTYVVFLGPLLHGGLPVLGGTLGFVALFLVGLVVVVTVLGLLAAYRARKASRGE